MQKLWYTECTYMCMCWSHDCLQRCHHPVEASWPRQLWWEGESLYFSFAIASYRYRYNYIHNVSQHPFGTYVYNIVLVWSNLHDVYVCLFIWYYVGRIAWDRGSAPCDSTTLSEGNVIGPAGQLICRSGAGCSGRIGSLQFQCTDFSVDEKWSAGQGSNEMNLNVQNSRFWSDMSCSILFTYAGFVTNPGRLCAPAGKYALLVR